MSFPHTIPRGIAKVGLVEKVISIAVIGVSAILCPTLRLWSWRNVCALQSRLGEQGHANEICDRTEHSREVNSAEKKKGRRLTPARRRGCSTQNENLSPN